jgi:hypothetical protein
VPDTESPPPAEAAPAKAPVRSVERWAERKKTPLLWMRAACVAQRWKDPRQVLVTEADYDAAIAAAQNVECR